MMPWDWIGIVTIRSDTRCSTSTNGMISRNPGSRGPCTRPSRNRTPCSYCLTILAAIASPSRASTTTTTITMIRASIMGLLFSYQDELRSRASVLVRERRPDREIVVTGITDACQPVILAAQAPGRRFYPDACNSLAAVSREHCQGIKKPALPCHRGFRGLTCQGPELISYITRLFRKGKFSGFSGAAAPKPRPAGMQHRFTCLASSARGSPAARSPYGTNEAGHGPGLSAPYWRRPQPRLTCSGVEAGREEAPGG